MGRMGCSLFADKRFADVVVLLVVQQSNPPSPPPSAERLPTVLQGVIGSTKGHTLDASSNASPADQQPQHLLPEGTRIHVHSVVLAAVSGYFDARLTRPLSSSDPSALRDPQQGCQVLVEYCEDEAHLKAAEAVLQCMYEEQVPGTLTMRELALCCRIADKWQASSCADTCFVALTQRRDEQLDRQAALAIVQLLPECVQTLPEYVAWVQRCQGIILTDGAAGKDVRCLLIAAFGDVHAMLSTPTWLRLFLQLPFEALCLWASSDDLVVDSENSVVVALDCWLQGYVGRNSQCKGDLTLRQLSDLVRVRHLSPVYLLRLPQMSWFKHNGMLQHFTAAVLAGSVGGMLGTWDVPPAWKLPPRRQLPDAVLSQRTCIRWEVQGVELTETRLKHIALNSPSMYMAGAAYCLTLGSGAELSMLSVGVKPTEFTMHAEGKLITVVPPSVQPLQLESYRVALMMGPGQGPSSGSGSPWGLSGGEGLDREGRGLCWGGKVSIGPPLGWLAPNLFNRNMGELQPHLVDGKLRLKAAVRVMRSTYAAECNQGLEAGVAAGLGAEGEGEGRVRGKGAGSVASSGALAPAVAVGP